jgi:hypothetical protein
MNYEEPSIIPNSFGLVKFDADTASAWEITGQSIGKFEVKLSNNKAAWLLFTIEKYVIYLKDGGGLIITEFGSHAIYMLKN